jgi:hypothetical protein
LHEVALSVIPHEFEQKDHALYTYLLQLFAPPPSEEDDTVIPRRKRASDSLPSAMRDEFIDLQSRLHPENLMEVLKEMDRDSLQWQQVIDICERNEAWDVVVWALDWQHEPQAALKKAEHYYRQLTRRIIDSLSNHSDTSHEIHILQSLGLIGRDICLERSQGPQSSEIPLEDLWFSLLSSQIHSVQTVSAVDDENQFDDILASLRSSVKTTFTALVSITSTQAVSFPRLFKRLVNSTPTTTGTQYTEFRLILAGMLESYHSDADMLVITRHLIDRDLFETIATHTAEKGRGWAPDTGRCTVCRKPIIEIGVVRAAVSQSDSTPPTPQPQIIVSRTGAISHSSCLTQSIPQNVDSSLA